MGSKIHSVCPTRPSCCSQGSWYIHTEGIPQFLVFHSVKWRFFCQLEKGSWWGEKVHTKTADHKTTFTFSPYQTAWHSQRKKWVSDSSKLGLHSRRNVCIVFCPGQNCQSLLWTALKPKWEEYSQWQLRFWSKMHPVNSNLFDKVS